MGSEIKENDTIIIGVIFKKNIKIYFLAFTDVLYTNVYIIVLLKFIIDIVKYMKV